MTKKQIEKATREWINILGVQNSEVDVVFVKKLRSKDTVAQNVWDAQYLTGIIEYSIPRLKEVDDNAIVHEIVHFFTTEMIDYVRSCGVKVKMLDYFNERLVCTITNLILRIINNNVKYGKNKVRPRKVQKRSKV